MMMNAATKIAKNATTFASVAFIECAKTAPSASQNQNAKKSEKIKVPIPKTSLMNPRANPRIAKIKRNAKKMQSKIFIVFLL